MNYKKGSFTTVPNKEILRGKDAIAQIVFMWLCSYADEEGVCFPSRSKLAKDCNVTVDTIDRKVKYLADEGLVKKTTRKDGEVNKSNLYQILLVEDEGVAVQEGQGSLTKDTRGSLTNTTLTQSIKNSIQLTPGDVPSQDIVSIIDLWKPLNHNYDSWYSNNTQRGAVSFLLGKYGYDKVSTMVTQLPDIVSRKFAPKITTPLELKRDLSKLVLFINQERQSKSKRRIV